MYTHIPQSAGVYCITNNHNGRVYIGSGVNIRARCQKHFWYLRRGDHPSALLQNAFNKHGEEAFSVNALELCDAAEVVSREQFWIESRCSVGEKGYNIAPKAYSCKGVKRSAETRAKMSEAIKKSMTPERRAQISAMNAKRTPEYYKWCGAQRKGKPLSDEAKAVHLRVHQSEEVRAKISAGKMGKKFSAESRAKMSASKKGTAAHNKGKPASEETKAKLRAAWELRRHRK